MTANKRDDIRSAIFSSKQMASKVFTFFGSEIEMRQPSLQDALSLRSSDDDDANQSILIKQLISYAYVPGTEEKVFEEGDVASLLRLPFGKDFQNLVKVLEELTDVNFPKRDDT